MDVFHRHFTTHVQSISLQWPHDGHDGVSNHKPCDCLLNRLFGLRSKETSKLRVTGLCVGNSPVTGEFPAQMASNAENVSIWWRHHDDAGVRKYQWVVRFKRHRSNLIQYLFYFGYDVNIFRNIFFIYFPCEKTPRNLVWFISTTLWPSILIILAGLQTYFGGKCM